MGQLAPAGTNKNRQYLGVCGWGKDDSQRCRAGTWSQLQVATLSLPKKWTSVFRSRQNRVSNTLSLLPPLVLDHADNHQREHGQRNRREHYHAPVLKDTLLSPASSCRCLSTCSSVASTLSSRRSTRRVVTNTSDSDNDTS